ncbi:MAG: CHAD domain-containing protein [Deltaproteobacteria bacterium]
MTSPTDRRVLLARLEKAAHVPPLEATDSDSTLLDKLLYPHLVECHLQAARPWPEDTVDLVHDVRVASRRLVEALALAAPMLDKRRVKKAQAFAKGLRQALGAGREADVMRADLERLLETVGLERPAVEAHTIAGEDPLERVKAAYPPELLLRRGVDVMRMAAAPKVTDVTTGRIAGPHLLARAAATEPLIDSVLDPDRLDDQHRLRIRFKRLRYTVEMIGPAFGDVIDKKATVKTLKALQDALGDLNDMKDLLEWLRSRAARDELGAARAAVLEAARVELDRRQAHAQELVLTAAPPLVRDLDRAAGVIGPLAF